MDEEKMIDGLARVEAKLDLVLPHINKIQAIENDILFVKKVIGWMGGGIVAVGGWIATYLGAKHQ